MTIGDSAIDASTAGANPLYLIVDNGIARVLLEHCRERMAGFKRPKRLVTGELPKTSTGKIRKNELRDLARSTT